MDGNVDEEDKKGLKGGYGLGKGVRLAGAASGNIGAGAGAAG